MGTILFPYLLVTIGFNPDPPRGGCHRGSVSLPSLPSSHTTSYTFKFQVRYICEGCMCNETKRTSKSNIHVLNHFESHSFLNSMRGVFALNCAKSKRFAGRSITSANITRFVPLGVTANSMVTWNKSITIISHKQITWWCWRLDI